MISLSSVLSRNVRSTPTLLRSSRRPGATTFSEMPKCALLKGQLDQCKIRQNIPKTAKAKPVIHDKELDSLGVDVPACLYVSSFHKPQAVMALTSTPRPSRHRSVTRPNPGTFLTGKSRMKRVMAERSNSISYCPFGLFLSEQIYSQSRTMFTLYLGKHLVGSDTGRYRQARLLLHSCSQLRDDFTGRHPCSFHVWSYAAYQPRLQEWTYLRYPSSRLAIARFGSYSANTDRMSLEVDTYRSK